MVGLIKVILVGIRIIAPYVLGAIGLTLRLVAMTLTSLWVGVPTACKNVAEELLERAVRAGFPTLYCQQLYYSSYVAALIVIIGGWVALAFITVTIISWLF